MVYRVYVEKKKGLEHEANSIYREITEMLGKHLECQPHSGRVDVNTITDQLGSHMLVFRSCGDHTGIAVADAGHGII